MLVAKEVDGIEMGVLDDGTPFLTGRGLAKACGVAPSAIIKQADAWSAGRKPGGRLGALGKLLADAGYDEPELFVVAKSGGRRVHAYTDSVCTIVIGYYAFEVSPPSQSVINMSRHLMRGGLRQLIYRSVGYDPRNVMPPGWREFYDRVVLITSPPGYFSVFRELDEFVLRAAPHGLILDSKTVPDISVGRTWSAFWTERDLTAKYGDRIEHQHCYPASYPQSWSNPQDIWVYPIEAMGAFRRWLDEVYIPEKFPAYLKGQVRKNVMTAATMMGLLAAVTPARLEERAETDDGEEDAEGDGEGADESRRSATARRR